MHDLVIIGAGPAGITASIYAARKKMDFFVLTGDVGGQTLWTRDIENYTGFQLISGTELVKRFKEHMDQFQVPVKENEKVLALVHDNDGVKITTNKGDYAAHTAIIATGRTHRKLSVEGEEAFRGRGVAYCATCDAPLFGGMDVAVVGGGNSALDATLQLIRIANKVTLIDTAKELRADPVMVEKAMESGKVTYYPSSAVQRIFGDKFVKGIIVKRGDGSLQDLVVRGVFVGIGTVAASEFVHGIFKNIDGEIIVNCGCETNIPGVFAAGDVTNVPAKQIVVASGEGAKATLSAFHYVSRKLRTTQPRAT